MVEGGFVERYAGQNLAHFAVDSGDGATQGSGFVALHTSTVIGGVPARLIDEFGGRAMDEVFPGGFGYKKDVAIGGSGGKPIEVVIVAGLPDTDDFDGDVEAVLATPFVRQKLIIDEDGAFVGQTVCD